MSVVTLAVVSAPGGGQEATGAGRGGTTETPATAPLYCDTTQRTLHLHFLHCTTDTLCTILWSIHTDWRSHYLINHTVFMSGILVCCMSV